MLVGPTDFTQITLLAIAAGLPYRQFNRIYWDATQLMELNSGNGTQLNDGYFKTLGFNFF